MADIDQNGNGIASTAVVGQPTLSHSIQVESLVSSPEFGVAYVAHSIPQTILAASIVSTVVINEPIVFGFAASTSVQRAPIPRPIAPVPNSATKVNKKNNYQYSDLDALFFVHPNTGDLTRVFDLQAIRTSVRNIVLTNKYERQFDPLFGSNIVAQLFELATPAAIEGLKKRIQFAVANYEPRVKVNKVLVDYDNQHTYTVTIQYTVIAEEIKQETIIKLERVR